MKQPNLKKLMVSMVTAATLTAGTSAYAEDPIKIGGIYILSGSAATYGEFAQKGIDLAVSEINESGGILGRDIEMIYEDSQGKASVAIQAARKLVYSEGADALVGLDSSGWLRAWCPPCRNYRNRSSSLTPPPRMLQASSVTRSLIASV